MSNSPNPNFQVPAEMRDLAEKSVEQARKAFGSFVAATHRTAETVQGSAERTRATANTMAERGFAFAEQNVHAAFDLAQKLARAKDAKEAMELQAEFARSQFATYQTQLKEYGDLAQGALQQGAEDTKSAVQQGAAEVRKVVEESGEAAAKAAPKPKANS